MNPLQSLVFNIKWSYKYKIYNPLKRHNLAGWKQRNLCKRKNCFNPASSSECGFLYSICETHSHEKPEFNTKKFPESKEGVCENYQYHEGDLPVIQDLTLILPYDEDMNQYNQKNPMYVCNKCLGDCEY